MTKNSYLKQEIRARMERTGESYSVAARAVGKTPGLSSATDHNFDGGEEASFSALIIFTEQLSTLLTTGLAFKDALSATADHTADPVLRQALHAVLADKEAGDFGGAMAKYPTAFRGILPTVVTAMLTTGSYEPHGLRAMAALYRTHLEVEREISTVDDDDDELFGSLLEEEDFLKQPVDTRPHTVVVGDKRIAQAAMAARPAWRFHHFSTIESFTQCLGKGEESLTSAVAVLVASAGPGWSARGKEVADLADWLAPYCLFGVISSYSTDFTSVTAELRSRRAEDAPKIYSIHAGEKMAETLTLALGAFQVEAPDSASDALRQLG